VNLEVGLLRRVLKKNRQWARLADEVRMLPEHPKDARVLAPDEKTRLLEFAKSKPEWQLAYCAAVLALNTTCRSCELRGLRWNVIDWTAMTMTIKRQTTKTKAGARVIPLNADALVALMELRDRADKLGSRDANHFVFPACENEEIEPTRGMKGWRTAWRSLTRAISCPKCSTIQQQKDVCENEKCRAEINGLKSPLAGLRFHDLRHHAVTELTENGFSDQTIMSIAGHVSQDMLNHYSHIRLEAKRRALEILETNRKHARENSVTSQSTSQSTTTSNPTPAKSFPVNEPCWIRTSDPLLKRQMLYRLS
jgi:integrase